MNAGRLDRARAETEASGWAGVLATPGINFTWLTGLALDRSERLTCLGVPRRGTPWIVCPAFEAERLGAALAGIEIISWEESDDPFALAARQCAAATGPWALEPTTEWHDGTRLMAAMPATAVEDGAALFAALRRRKDAGEIQALRRAIADAWAVYDAILPELAPGATEREVADRVLALFGARGCQGWALVQFGPGSAVPHGESGARALEPGQAVLFDWGGWRDGFTADLTRTIWWEGGSVPAADAPAPFRAIQELVRSAQRAALERAGPGVACGAVDAAARDVITAAGHGPQFTHRLGHGLGLEIHEAPYLVTGSPVPLAPGDVVTVEPGVYLPGILGVRWEDDVLVTDGGIEVLSHRAATEEAP
ncbi:MAG: M24 family metallopeptidase [Gemmatimonadota bacterium]